jgi:hypothetical protein
MHYLMYLNLENIVEFGIGIVVVVVVDQFEMLIKYIADSMMLLESM